MADRITQIVNDINSLQLVFNEVLRIQQEEEELRQQRRPTILVLGPKKSTQRPRIDLTVSKVRIEDLEENSMQRQDQTLNMSLGNVSISEAKATLDAQAAQAAKSRESSKVSRRLPLISEVPSRRDYFLERPARVLQRSIRL